MEKQKTKNKTKQNKIKKRYNLSLFNTYSYQLKIPGRNQLHNQGAVKLCTDGQEIKKTQ